jgi:hypothetical protein
VLLDTHSFAVFDTQTAHYFWQLLMKAILKVRQPLKIFSFAQFPTSLGEIHKQTQISRFHQLLLESILFFL